MINDFTFSNDDDRIDTATELTKTVFGENNPYYIYPTGLGRDQDLVIFSDHFIDTTRLVLSDPSGGTIVQMSEQERSLYYDYVDYQNGDYTEGVDTERDSVVITMDECISDELTCKNATWLQRCFDSTHDFDSCNNGIAEPSLLTVKITEDNYDALSEPLDTITYIITIDGIISKIAIGSVVLWTI